jgi:hypothetical protein
VSISAIATRRPLSAVSGQALLLGACAVAAAVWVGLVGLQSQHAFLHEAVPVLLAPLALWLFFSERYEVTLAVLLLYLGLLDGVVKLASGSSVATLGRDVLLYAIALGAVVRMILRRTPVARPLFAGIVLAWVAVCVMQVANPSSVSLLHSISALRQHLEFVPLFFFGYYVLRSERRLTGLLLLFLVIASANGVVGLVQSRLTPAQLATWGPGYSGLENGTASRVAQVFGTADRQTKVRPPGLGGTDGFGGLVGVIALPGAIALFSSARRSVKLGWLLIPATILTILAIVTSQTRLDVACGVIAVVGFLALTLTSRRGMSALLATILVALAGYFILSTFVSSSANRYSTIAPTKALGTAVAQRQGTIALIPRYIVDYPLGAGLGTVGPATGSTFGGSVARRALNGESEFTFLLVETGIPGLLVMLTFMVVIIKAGLGLRRAADPGLQRSLMALIAVVVTLCVAWVFTAVTADPPSAPFLWVSAGGLAYWYGEMWAGRLRVRPRLVGEALALR